MVSRSEYIYILSWISGGFSRSMFQEAPHHRAGRAYELHRYGDVGRLGPRFGPIQRWHHRSLAELGGRTWGEVWNQHQPDINQQFVHGKVNVSALGELEPCRFFLIRAIGHLPCQRVREPSLQRDLEGGRWRPGREDQAEHHQVRPMRPMQRSAKRLRASDVSEILQRRPPAVRSLPYSTISIIT